MRSTRRLGIAAAALALALTACSSGATGKASKRLIPPEQAVQQLSALLDESLSEVRPKLRYRDEWPRSTEQYSRGLDEHSLGYATASRRRHIMTKVSPAKYGVLLDMVRRGLQARGYTVNSAAPDRLAVSATTPDGSGVGITIHPAGNIDIGASVGPVPVADGHDSFGTPTPEPTMSNGNPDILPRDDDPFWSN
ncbi:MULTISPECIES: hypothetical protein [unclassified Kitasatospora]|uniref:hypothetical protein n=1 Tax=unclassified Kitasatospora TaxID=2633591 RepID=UPI0038168FDC